MDISTSNNITRRLDAGRRDNATCVGRLVPIAVALIVCALLGVPAVSNERPDAPESQSTVVWQAPSPESQPPGTIVIESEAELLPSRSGSAQGPGRITAVDPDEPIPPPESGEPDDLPNFKIEKLHDISIDIGVPDDLEKYEDEAAAPAARYFGAAIPYARHAMATGPGYVPPEYGPDLNFCYRPLYFEEVNLERYGHSGGVFQPAISAARFYANTVVLPYRLVKRKSCYCTYHDHHFRPGASAPPERHLHGH